jgi:hypothetical protein
MSNQQDSKFLRDQHRAKQVIRAKPDIQSKELAESLGLKSVLYAHTVKVYVKAQEAKEEKKGA